MTKKEKQEWLNAIDLMEKHYRGEVHLGYCLFCKVADDCNTCLWVIFEGKYCHEFARPYCKKDDFGVGNLRDRPTRHWRKIRLKQLADWRKRLEEL